VARKSRYRDAKGPSRGTGQKILVVYMALALAVEFALLAILTAASLGGPAFTLELSRGQAARKLVPYGALATGAVLAMAVGTMRLWGCARESEQLAARERQTLATWASHQIRNPLAVISGHAQLLAEADHPTCSQGAGRRILEQSARINGALAQLTALCEPVLLERTPVDLRTLLQAATHSCVRDFAATEVTCRVSGDFGPATGDPQLLGEALRNVILNAVESLELRDGTGRVQITGRLSCQGTIVVVEDNGCGIPARRCAQVFDIGYTTKPRALGMGLTMARAVLRLHGGTICLEPGDGSGTRAIITLPFPRL